MRIGIDARLYGPANGGLGRYLEKLIENLEKIDLSTSLGASQNQYVIFLRKENLELYQPQNQNFKKALADYSWYTLIEQLKMPPALKKERLDLVHFPHFNVPFFYRGKFVVTIHDLILLEFPVKRTRVSTLGPIRYCLKYWAHKLILKSAVRRAQKILTVSEYTKEQLIKRLKLPADKIVVTYEGGSVGEIPLSSPLEKRGEGEGDLEKYGINKEFLLYVGKAYPHKNLESLIRVFQKLQQEIKEKYQLVLVGKEDYFYRKLKDRVTGEKGIIFTGFVPDEELPIFYQQAALYVFPSFVEGFGLPPLEAMNYGLPVACSKTSCLPEILSDAALYFNPADEQDMLNVIKRGLNDQKLREELKEKGFRQVKLYDWEKCAKETLAVYEEKNFI